jgi:uncharacterized protein (UPF0261 family)
LNRSVVIIGNLHTDDAANSYLVSRLTACQISTININVGLSGKPRLNVDVSISDIAQAAGVSTQSMIEVGERQSTRFISEGIVKILRSRYSRAQLRGAICLGGSTEITIGLNVFDTLPIGIPKLVITGVSRPYFAAKDIMVIQSPVDLSGMDSVSKMVLGNAAAAISGMIDLDTHIDGERPMISVTTFGVTRICASQSKKILQDAGYQVLTFHTSGSGGRAMEDMISDGYITGVLDITITELADELVGGVLSAGPHRMEAASRNGIPQVIVPGAIDMVNFGPPYTVPDRFKGRRFYQWGTHSPTASLMRTTVSENARLGQIVANKINLSKGPVSVVIPTRGFSELDRKGEPFYDPEADRAFVSNLRKNLRQGVHVTEKDDHINDEEFAACIASILMKQVNQYLVGERL